MLSSVARCGPQERFLHDVLGIGDLTEHAICDGEQTRPVPVEILSAESSRHVRLLVPRVERKGGTICVFS
jgi:hypothetical protein